MPAEGFPFVHLVHVQDVADLMASIAGQPNAVGKTVQRRRRRDHQHPGCITLMARAVGVEADIVHVPMEIARRARPPLLHWGEALVGGAMFSIDAALADLDWTPSSGSRPAYRDSYEWFDREGRDRYEFDFSADDAILGSAGVKPHTARH